MRIVCYFLIIFLASANSLVAQAQSGDSPWENNNSPWETSKSQANSASRTGRPPTKPSSTPSPGGTPVPIDGGLVVLLAAGALYGRKAVRSRSKKTAE